MNLGVLAFTFIIFDQIKNFEFTYFMFLMILGFVSSFAAYRASVAYNFHFRNYEDAVITNDTSGQEFKRILENNRLKYASEKKAGALFNLGTSLVPSHVFWTLFIGLICPIVAVFAVFSFGNVQAS